MISTVSLLLMIRSFFFGGFKFSYPSLSSMLSASDSQQLAAKHIYIYDITPHHITSRLGTELTASDRSCHIRVTSNLGRWSIAPSCCFQRKLCCCSSKLPGGASAYVAVGSATVLYMSSDLVNESLV